MQKGLKYFLLFFIFSLSYLKKIFFLLSQQKILQVFFLISAFFPWKWRASFSTAFLPSFETDFPLFWSSGNLSKSNKHIYESIYLISLRLFHLLWNFFIFEQKKMLPSYLKFIFFDFFLLLYINIEKCECNHVSSCVCYLIIIEGFSSFIKKSVHNQRAGENVAWSCVGNSLKMKEELEVEVAVGRWWQ
jgi:hypothetical protein